MTTPTFTDELAEAYAKARLNLVNFRHILLDNDADDVAAAPFHFEWSDILLHGTRNFAIEAFRESAKSQYVLRAFPLYCLTFPKAERSYIVLIKNNTHLAIAKLRETQKEFTTNPRLNQRLKRINEQSGQVFDVDLEDADDPTKIVNVRIEAYGKGASIRGLSNLSRRPDIVIIDDPQDIKDAESDTIQESDWTWFLSDVKFLGKKCRIFLIGNNLGEKCIIERVFANPKELDCEVKRLPAIVADIVTQEVGPPIPVERSSWPEQFSVEKLQKEKEDYQKLGKVDIWLRERLCVAIADETRIFHREDLRYYAWNTADRIAKDCNLFMAVDPAASTKERADYRACVVVGIDHRNNWFVLDCSYGLYDTKKLIDEMFRLVTLWNLRSVAIEEGALKASMEPFLYSKMSDDNVFFDLIPLKAKQQKEQRIKLLQPRVKAHTIWLPDTASWLAEMVAELLAFTMQGSKGLHDDLIDALAYIEQIAQKPHGKVAQSNLPRTGQADVV